MYEGKILPIVVAGITNKKKWLFIKRKKGDYKGYLALIGGKLEYGEELREAILREVREETGLNGTIQKISAIINERLIEENEFIRQFIIFVFEVRVEEQITIEKNQEGELRWITKEQIKQIKDKLIPSDYYMMTLIWKKKERLIISDITIEQNRGKLKIVKLKEY